MSSTITYAEHPAAENARRRAKDRMSVTQTFVLAHKARSKLSREASRPNHDLRHLVLTANLLDSLMLHLSHAEQDQEAWYNGSAPQDSRTEAGADASPSLVAISEEPELSWTSGEYSDSDSDSNSDSDADSDFDSELEFGPDQVANAIIGNPQALSSEHYSQGVPSITIEITSGDDENDEENEEEEDGFYLLQRMPSRAPSLIEDVSDSDEDESNPPSPRQAFAVPVLTEKERQSLVTTSFYDESSEESVSFLDRSTQMQRSANLIAVF